MKMTPQEIFEYKQKWKPRCFDIQVHSDKEQEAIQWCKNFCESEEWNLLTWTDVYEHTFIFEQAIHAQAFAREYSL